MGKPSNDDLLDFALESGYGLIESKQGQIVLTGSNAAGTKHASNAQDRAIELVDKNKRLRSCASDALPWLQYTLGSLVGISKTRAYVGDKCIKQEIEKLTQLIGRIENENSN